MKKYVLFIMKTITLYATIPGFRYLGDITSSLKKNKRYKLHSCLRQKSCLMVSMYNFENAGRKLKPDRLK